jgi:hypothetical protein
MSSALLYVAIVAIWACVLIPRWLRRGSSAANPTEETLHYPERSIPSLPLSAPVPTVDAEQYDLPAEQYADERYADQQYADQQYADQQYADQQYADEPVPGEPAADEVAPARPEPLSREESRRRMMAARRRLLIMLLGLEAAACALTVLGLAALWVLIPPTVMMAGYMLLLREASKADRELTRREAAETETRAHAHSRAGSRATAPATGSAARPARRRLATEEDTATEATAPAEPRPEDYEDLGHGRDFAPGLIDSGEDEYRRAVGD